MKLIAVAERGSIKDFVDIHALWKVGWNFSVMFDTLQHKYKTVNYNGAHILKSLTYFVDADKETMPAMFNEVTWSQVKMDLANAVAAAVMTPRG